MNITAEFVVAIPVAIALTLGIALAYTMSPDATTQRHHRQTRDLYGRVTCEYCLGLIKGVSHEQH